MKAKRQFSQRDVVAVVEQLRWSQPMKLSDWAAIFHVHRNTMRKWLDNQIIKNQQISPRMWRVAIEELPSELVLQAFEQMQAAEIFRQTQNKL